MSADTTLPPWLIIVHRNDDVLYHHLRQAFESDPQVTVIKDRRHADRRTQAMPVAMDRRRLDRRAAPTTRDEKIWQSLRFRLIHRDEAVKVYEAANEPREEALPTTTTKAAKKPLARPRPGTGARRSVGSSPPARPRRGRSGRGRRV